MSFSSLYFFFFNDTATTEIYTLSLHDALPICSVVEAEPEDYPWIGIDSRGREFRYAHGSPITDRELALLGGLIDRLQPDAIGMSVTTPLRKRNVLVTQFVKTLTDAPVIWGGYDPT